MDNNSCARCGGNTIKIMPGLFICPKCTPHESQAPDRPVPISSIQLGLTTRQLWIEQVTPMLMQMAQDTRGDGVQRGIILIGHGKCQVQVQVTVTRVANEDISKPVVLHVAAADLLQITPGDS